MIFIEILFAAFILFLIIYHFKKSNAQKRQQQMAEANEAFSVDEKRAEILADIARLEQKYPADIEKRKHELAELEVRLQKINQLKKQLK